MATEAAVGGVAAVAKVKRKRQHGRVIAVTAREKVEMAMVRRCAQRRRQQW